MIRRTGNPGAAQYYNLHDLDYYYSILYLENYVLSHTLTIEYCTGM